MEGGDVRALSLIVLVTTAVMSSSVPAHARAETQWTVDTWNSFHDWFVDDLAEALQDSARFRIRDTDGVVSARLFAANEADAGTWETYEFVREDPEGDWWLAPPPVNQMIPGKEIFYYCEATDGLGDTSVFPVGAPSIHREFSILPIYSSLEDPGLLLVDKHGRRIPGANDQWKYFYEYYVREAMDILGYTYDVYDVEIPTASTSQSNGPDTTGMKYYDTQMWFSGDLSEASLNKRDQQQLILWLSEAGPDAERNLLMTGNGIGRWVALDNDTLDFYSEWLAAEYLGCTGFTFSLGVCDEPGEHDFMTYADAECALYNGYSLVCSYEYVQPMEGIPGTEIPVRYVYDGGHSLPAGVAHTHPTLGYRTVYLGFGTAFMMEGVEGEQFFGGIEDRVDLISNIMAYFNRLPERPGTGVEHEAVLPPALRGARPNPFNPATTIEYSIDAPGHVTLRVHDVAGHLVRTLVDAEQGPRGYEVSWDGTTDGGFRAASGVYFLRMEVPGYEAVRRLVLLK
jgi:hypothetical protein